MQGHVWPASLGMKTAKDPSKPRFVVGALPTALDLWRGCEDGY
jgi:hypothetical protein